LIDGVHLSGYPAKLVACGYHLWCISRGSAGAGRWLWLTLPTRRHRVAEGRGDRMTFSDIVIFLVADPGPGLA
jgi:hypothetical protein